mgnify:CR=1 FL=1
MEMIRPENFKEELDDNNPNKLELQKKGVQTQIVDDVDKQKLLNSIAESREKENSRCKGACYIAHKRLA